jgi:tripartite-type tricarboxylate transporter receptor subunit TctC
MEFAQDFVFLLLLFVPGFAAITLKLVHVPFEGGELVITAVLGDHAELTVDGFSKLKLHMEAGTMMVLVKHGFAKSPEPQEPRFLNHGRREKPGQPVAFKRQCNGSAR